MRGIDEVRETIAGLPDLAAAAAAILDAVERAGGGPLAFEEALRDTGRSEPDGPFLAALSHLGAGRDPALAVRVVFRDEAGAEHPVRTDDRANYRHPVTGAAVADPERHMYVRVVPVPGLLDGDSPPPRM